MSLEKSFVDEVALLAVNPGESTGETNLQIVQVPVNSEILDSSLTVPRGKILINHPEIKPEIKPEFDWNHDLCEEVDSNSVVFANQGTFFFILFYFS